MNDDVDKKTDAELKLVRKAFDDVTQTNLKSQREIAALRETIQDQASRLKQSAEAEIPTPPNKPETARDVLAAIVAVAASPDRRSDKIDYADAVIDLDLLNRARAALATETNQSCPNVVSGREGTQYCALAESSVAALLKENARLNARVTELISGCRDLGATRDAYGKALDNVGAMASHLFYELHGGKMDGPHNKTEVVLLDISNACTAALNGEDNPRA